MKMQNIINNEEEAWINDHKTENRLHITKGKTLTQLSRDQLLKDIGLQTKQLQTKLESLKEDYIDMKRIGSE